MINDILFAHNHSNGFEWLFGSYSSFKYSNSIRHNHEEKETKDRIATNDFLANEATTKSLRLPNTPEGLIIRLGGLISLQVRSHSNTWYSSVKPGQKFSNLVNLRKSDW